MTEGSTDDENSRETLFFCGRVCLSLPPAHISLIYAASPTMHIVGMRTSPNYFSELLRRNITYNRVPHILLFPERLLKTRGVIGFLFFYECRLEKAPCDRFLCLIPGIR